MSITDEDDSGDLGVTFWVLGDYVDKDDDNIWDHCESTNITVTKHPKLANWEMENDTKMGMFYYEVKYNFDGRQTSDCSASGMNKENILEGKRMVKVGRGCLACTVGEMEFTSNAPVWVTYDDKNLQKMGEAGEAIALGFGSGCCGVLVLIIGIVLAVVLRENNIPTMVMGPDGMMIPQQMIPTGEQVMLSAQGVETSKVITIGEQPPTG